MKKLLSLLGAISLTATIPKHLMANPISRDRRDTTATEKKM